MARIADFGHGSSTPMDAAEAIRIALDATAGKLCLRTISPAPGVSTVGQQVRSVRVDYGTGKSPASFVYEDRREIVIASGR